MLLLFKGMSYRDAENIRTAMWQARKVIDGRLSSQVSSTTPSPHDNGI